MKHEDSTNWKGPTAVKFSLVMMCLVLTPAAPAQREKRPIVYAKHVELPHYPPLARQTRVSGTVVMKLMIAADGTVLSVEPVASSDTKNIHQLLDKFRDDAERTIKTWTFGCAGCPPNATYEHIIRFNYKLGDSMQFGEPDRFVMDLPDEVVISTAPIMVETGGPAKKPRRGNS
jgi:Gram-negative bacterial TonB protein C-terminal